MHLEHIGKETCPVCGTHHRVLESLPKHPLTERDVKAVAETDDIEAAIPVMFMSGAPFGIEGDVAEDIVLATDSGTRLVGFYEHIGWVVDIEVEHDDGDDPSTMAQTIAVYARQTSRDELLDIL